MNVRLCINAELCFSVDANSEAQALEEAANLVEDLKVTGLAVLGLPNDHHAKLWLAADSELQIVDVED